MGMWLQLLCVIAGRDSHCHPMCAFNTAAFRNDTATVLHTFTGSQSVAAARWRRQPGFAAILARQP